MWKYFFLQNINLFIFSFADASLKETWERWNDSPGRWWHEVVKEFEAHGGCFGLTQWLWLKCEMSLLLKERGKKINTSLRDDSRTESPSLRVSCLHIEAVVSIKPFHFCFALTSAFFGLHSNPITLPRSWKKKLLKHNSGLLSTRQRWLTLSIARWGWSFAMTSLNFAATALTFVFPVWGLNLFLHFSPIRLIYMISCLLKTPVAEHPSEKQTVQINITEPWGDW